MGASMSRLAAAGARARGLRVGALRWFVPWLTLQRIVIRARRRWTASRARGRQVAQAASGLHPARAARPGAR